MSRGSSQQILLVDAHQARGTVVVMDVLRAFTTAAFAFAGGVERIVMVAEVDQALDLQREHPDWLLMGEVAGRPIEGFDFSNSPTQLLDAHLQGRTLIQRTTAGTRGIVLARNARRLFCGSLVCATALASNVGTDDEVSYVITEGDEDVAGADFIESKRVAGEVDERAIRDRVYQSRAGRQLLIDSSIGVPKDVELACDIDRFDFAIVAEHTDIGVIARTVPGVNSRV